MASESGARLSDEGWRERFIARMMKRGEGTVDLAGYAEFAAPLYLLDRDLYASPEEAADVDMSYWED